MLLTFVDEDLVKNPTISNFIDFLISVKEELGDLPIATYDYENAKIKKAIFDNTFDVYAKLDSDGELITTDRDDADGQEYFCLNI